jgi:hypothetical protein
MQGKRPTCSAFATSAVLENLARQRGREIDIAEEHVWFLTKRDQGNLPNTAAAVQVINRYFLVPETVWPYNGRSTVEDRNGLGVVRSRSYRKVRVTAASVQGSLQRRSPLLLLVDVTESFRGNRTGVIDPRAPLAADNPGHALAVVGFHPDSRVDGGGYMIVKNSWSEAWGDRGYGYIPLGFCARYRCEAWVIGDIELR